MKLFFKKVGAYSVIIYNWLKNINIVPIATLISTIVAVCALLYSVKQFNQTFEKEEMTNRPVIGIVEYKISYDTLPLRVVPLFTFKNVGNRICKNIEVTSYTASQKNGDSNIKVEDAFHNEFVNSLIPQAIGIELGVGKFAPINNHEYYFKVIFSYKDYVSQKFYSDSFYTTWTYDSTRKLTANFRGINKKSDAHLLDIIFDLNKK